MTGNDILITIVVSSLTILLVLSLVVALLLISSKRQYRHREELARAALQREQAVLRTEHDAVQRTLNEVSMELHDNVAQLLSLAKLGLGAEMSGQPPSKVLSGAHEGVALALAEVRRLSLTLNADLWKSRTLLEAIQQDAQRVQLLAGMVVHVETSGDLPKLTVEMKTGLYRAFQEVVNNAVKHSGATTLRVTVSGTPNFSITIADDGAGFDPDKTRSSGGLVNIPQRCARIGFDATCTSARGQGCTWHITQRPTDGQAASGRTGS
ncbi:MAG: hypothetical protein IPO87_18160 [Flavobacteriales bacterium]|nr:hypothetical protein [Flavobacteriales bacterium]